MNYTDYVAHRPRACISVVHRGIWRDAPENSLLAIERTIDAGHKVVEIDVRQTVDGNFVLLHDDTLERMTGVGRAPEELTSPEVAALRLRNRDGGSDNAATQEKVASLGDVFDLTRDRLFIHLDVKTRDLIPAVKQYAREMRVLEQVDFWTNLQTAEDLQWVRSAVDPRDVLFMPKIRLNAADAVRQVELALQLGSSVFEIVYDSLDEIVALRDRLEGTGISIWCNTLDGVACAGFTDTAAVERPEEIWGRLIDAGVSVIQTDYADRLEAFVSSRPQNATPGRTHRTGPAPAGGVS